MGRCFVSGAPARHPPVAQWTSFLDLLVEKMPFWWWQHRQILFPNPYQAINDSRTWCERAGVEGWSGGSNRYAWICAALRLSHIQGNRCVTSPNTTFLLRAAKWICVVSANLKTLNQAWPGIAAHSSSDDGIERDRGSGSLPGNGGRSRRSMPT